MEIELVFDHQSLVISFPMMTNHQLLIFHLNIMNLNQFLFNILSFSPDLS